MPPPSTSFVAVRDAWPLTSVLFGQASPAHPSSKPFQCYESRSCLESHSQAKVFNYPTPSNSHVCSSYCCQPPHYNITLLPIGDSADAQPLSRQGSAGTHGNSAFLTEAPVQPKKCLSFIIARRRLELSHRRKPPISHSVCSISLFHHGVQPTRSPFLLWLTWRSCSHRLAPCYHLLTQRSCLLGALTSEYRMRPACSRGMTGELVHCASIANGSSIG
ncbi:hypothetical protein C8R42DRAFT_779529 [Lentinula raphanica]|nr:hypothetical protein C8R42DRAFT_779529 [Lentinula raphanica]